MARGRMLNRSISTSLKFDLLSDDTSRLLATWIVAHLDVNGVFYGDPGMVRSLVFPRRADVPVERIERYLQQMERVGLMFHFEAAGDLWQCWPGFAHNQPGLRRDREHTTFPVPPAERRQSGGTTPADCGSESAKIPAEEQHEVEREGEQQQLQDPVVVVVEETGKRDNDGAEVFQAYEANIGVITEAVSQQIDAALTDTPAGWIIDAIQEAALHNHRSWSYVAGILRNWNENGRGSSTGPPARASPPGASGPRMSAEEKARYLERLSTDRQE